MTALLAMPPFPGAKIGLQRAPGAAPLPECDLDRCLSALVAHRVGGTFWGMQPLLPEGKVELVQTETARFPVPRADATALAWPPCSGTCDPWAVLDRVSRLWSDDVGTLAILAYARGIEAVRISDHAPFPEAEIRTAACVALGNLYLDPFSDAPLATEQAISLLGFWRELIDSNRNIGAAAGMAFWKRGNVEPLLWSGTPLRFVSREREAGSLPEGTRLAVWKSRTAAKILGAVPPEKLIEVEDGFIRSAGLGADCVPPFSIVVDPIGVHFDPAAPSLLEQLIEEGACEDAVLARARKLIDRIVQHGVGKYGLGRQKIARPGGRKRHVLVTGQVEDDRSVLAGRGDVTGNLDLLQRARALEPDSFIIYRPHPDVEAGHRKGAIADSVVLRHADGIDRTSDIASLIELADAVHVLTSLAGFEALLRGREVVTHGVPFYAGWGLTRDLGQVPARRRARPSLEELVATVLLTYPRYLDPVTRLPCPPEVLIDRLISGAGARAGVVTFGRRVGGRMNRVLNRSRVGT